MLPEPSTLDDVEFLVSSHNRLKVFDAVQSTSRTRHELREMTDASRVTLSRILSDLENRNWVERTSAGYTVTPSGAVVAAEVAQLFANLDALHEVEDVLQWLPVELFNFELACLSDATVLSSTDRNLTAAITHTATRVREATRVQNVATGISSEVVDAYLVTDTRNERSLETVFHASVFDTIEGDATLRAQFHELLEADHVAVSRYDGAEPPVMLTISDEAVIMCGQSAPRSPPEGLESRDENVRAWATSYFDYIRRDATPVTPDAFTA